MLMGSLCCAPVLTQAAAHPRRYPGTTSNVTGTVTVHSDITGYLTLSARLFGLEPSVRNQQCPRACRCMRALQLPA